MLWPPIEGRLLSSRVLLLAALVHCWSEQDEAKRIAQIKMDEKRQFEQQTGQKLPPSVQYERSSSEEGLAGRQQDYSAAADERSSARPMSRSGPSQLAFAASSAANLSSSQWCFHCASPWHVLSEPMQRVVRNLLEVRRAAYPPPEAVTRSCVEPKGLDRLARQSCPGYSHCQTLILTDHNAGTAFTIRGCAERFGAVEPTLLASRKDNTCRRLHDQVDIQECICERRKYCHAGPERAWTLRYTEMGQWRGPLAAQDGPPAAALRRTNGGTEQQKAFGGPLLLALLAAAVFWR